MPLPAPLRVPKPRPNPGVRALLFDVFGTVVDWRGSIIAEAKSWGKARSISVDLAGFADQWRAGYPPSMDNVRRGKIPWTIFDHLHRARLEELLKELPIQCFTPL